MGLFSSPEYHTKVWQKRFLKVLKGRNIGFPQNFFKVFEQQIQLTSLSVSGGVILWMKSYLWCINPSKRLSLH